MRFIKLDIHFCFYLTYYSSNFYTHCILNMNHTIFFNIDIYNLKSKLVTVDPDVVQSNMLLLDFPSPSFSSEQFVERMAEVSPTHFSLTLKPGLLTVMIFYFLLCEEII